MAEAETDEQVSPKAKSVASRRARDRARVGKWDLNIAIFLFAVLILIIILATYTKAGIEIVAVVALFGLSMVWLVGWNQEKQLFKRYYQEELMNLEETSKVTLKAAVRETVTETIEEQVQKALRERWR